MTAVTMNIDKRSREFAPAGLAPAFGIPYMNHAIFDKTGVTVVRSLVPHAGVGGKNRIPLAWTQFRTLPLVVFSSAFLAGVTTLGVRERKRTLTRRTNRQQVLKFTETTIFLMVLWEM